MTYKIINGFVIHDPPVYPLDDEGVPTFLDGIERLAWVVRAKCGARQTRYSADGFHRPYQHDIAKVVGSKAYVCYSYRANGCEWRECGWEPVEH